MESRSLNKLFPKRLLQIGLIGASHTIALILLERILPGFVYTQVSALVVMTIGLTLTQSCFWWLFVNFFSRLPFWLYPVLTTLLNGLFIFLLGRFLPGIEIQNISTAILILAEMTAVNTLVSSYFSLGDDRWFDRYVIRGLGKRTGQQTRAEVPGFLFLEIDGLSEELLSNAIKNGYMPTLQKWLQSGSHKILGWETDFSSQTEAMQSGILMGKNGEIPAN